MVDVRGQECVQGVYYARALYESPVSFPKSPERRGAEFTWLTKMGVLMSDPSRAVLEPAGVCVFASAMALWRCLDFFPTSMHPER